MSDENASSPDPGVERIAGPSGKLYENEIDRIFRGNGHGDASRAATNTMFGFNHRTQGNMVSYNTENHGLTFFTRPMMNMAYHNITMDRVLSELTAGHEMSYTTMVRSILDPLLHKAGTNGDLGTWRQAVAGSDGVKPFVASKLVDPNTPFIAVLSNNLISLSGWPDPYSEIYTSAEGVMKESWSMVDGRHRDFSSYPLTATFRNILGDPITLLLHAWYKYSALVYKGTLLPYPQFYLEENIIDYQTRIYRIKLDRSKKYVTKIGATGVAFPMGPPLGAAMNFSMDSPLKDDNAEQLSVQFQCNGFEINDPILIREFNDVVAIANPAMFDWNRLSHSSKMVKLNDTDIIHFDGYGYPRIDLITRELEWWVDNETYLNVMEGR